MKDSSFLVVDNTVSLLNNNGEENGNPPSILAREFHGLYSPWGHKESDTTERFSHTE